MKSTFGALLRHELRVVGPWLFGIPLFVSAIFAIAAGMMAFKQAQHSDISTMIGIGLEAGIPLAAGIVIATIARQEPALEIQLTLPRPYRRTMLSRIGLMLGWTALIEMTAIVALGIALPWTLHRQGVAYVLMWLSPLLWFGGLGAALAFAMRSWAASGAILGVVWVVQLAFHGFFAAYGWTRPWYLFATLFSPNASFWLANRIELLVTGLVLLFAILTYLRNPEWRFRGEDA